MDEGIFIQQPENPEKQEQSEQQSLQIENEESLEHLVNQLIQYQQPDELKVQTGKRKLNDQRYYELELNEFRFTHQEDKRILELVGQVGPNFNKIVKQFPGKTMNMIKNRYYKKLRYIKDDSDLEVGKKHSRNKKANQF